MKIILTIIVALTFAVPAYASLFDFETNNDTVYHCTRDGYGGERCSDYYKF